MSVTHREVPVFVRPTMTEAAKMIGIHPTTLSRHPTARSERAGRRDLRFSPLEVMRLADEYKRRSLNQVASELIEYVAARDRAYVGAVETEIEGFFAGRQETTAGKDEFFADLERVLPPALFKKVRNMYFASSEIEPGELISDLTEEEEEEGL